MDTSIRDIIISRYIAGEIPRHIAPSVGYSKTQIHRVLKAAGVTRSVSASKRKLSMDHFFFDRIDTSEKAQILGFLYADGCMRPRVVAICLANEDHDYLEYIKRATKYSGQVRVYPTRRPNEQDASKLMLCSHKMVCALARLGCTPRKSLTLQFPTPDQVPDHLLAAFMLGYFEGDGSLSCTMRKRRMNPDDRYADFTFTICGTLQFCQRYGSILARETGTYFSVVEHNNIHMIRINGNRQIKRVMDWLYGCDVPYHLLRKRKAYDQLVSVLSDVQHNPRLFASIAVKSPMGAVYVSNCISKLHRDVLSASSSVVLYVPQFSRLMSGKIESYKGWTKATPDEVNTARTTGTLVERVY